MQNTREERWVCTYPKKGRYNSYSTAVFRVTLPALLWPQRHAHTHRHTRTLYYAFFRGRCKYLTSKLRRRWGSLCLFFVITFSEPFSFFLLSCAGTRPALLQTLDFFPLSFSFSKLISENYETVERFVVRQIKYSCATHALLEGKRALLVYFTFIWHSLLLSVSASCNKRKKAS